MSAQPYGLRITHTPGQPYPWCARLSLGGLDVRARQHTMLIMAEWCHDQFDVGGRGWTYGLDGFFFKTSDRAFAFKMRWG